MISKAIIELELGKENCEIKLLNTLKNRTVESTKTVPVTNLINILTKNISENATERDIIIPQGVARITENRSNKTYYFIFEPTIKNITVTDRAGRIVFNGNIPITKTLLVVGVPKNPKGEMFQQAQIHIYALKNDQDYAKNRTLYHFPYLNIFNDNRICWGSTHPSIGKNPDDSSKIRDLYDFFFESKFNFDLTPRLDYDEVSKTAKKKKISDANRVLQYLKCIKNEKAYPDKLLMKY